MYMNTCMMDEQLIWLIDDARAPPAAVGHFNSPTAAGGALLFFWSGRHDRFQVAATVAANQMYDSEMLL